FVACGALVLRPRELVPTGVDLLSLQAQFVSPGLPALRWLYYVGAFLTMFGTLYGTIEVAPAILQELSRALEKNPRDPRLCRRWAVGWVASGGTLTLLINLALHGRLRGGNAPGLVSMLTPAN